MARIFSMAELSTPVSLLLVLTELLVTEGVTFLNYNSSGTGTASRCPADFERRIPAGQNCTTDVGYYVNGEHTRDLTWNMTLVRYIPGKDCFPEGRYGVVYSWPDGVNCTVYTSVYGVCSWYPNHCWPGDCDRGLSVRCQCRPGFIKVVNQHGAVLCDSVTPPVLESCSLQVTDGRGRVTPASSGDSEGLTSCAGLQDAFINAYPGKVTFRLAATADPDLGNSPSYISRSQFGVVGATIEVLKVSSAPSLGNTEPDTVVVTEELNGSPYCRNNVSSGSPGSGRSGHQCQGDITLPLGVLYSGEGLCVVLTATSRGFYDLQTAAGQPQGRMTYSPLRTSQRTCFWYDVGKPSHCSDTAPAFCPSEPLGEGDSGRVTRVPELAVPVAGWSDVPGTNNLRPTFGRSPAAGGINSGISTMSLTLHEVEEVGTTHLEVMASAITTQLWNVSGDSSQGVMHAPDHTFAVTLPTTSGPKLYTLILEVQDKAGNVRYARRLVLYDNTSSVELDASKSLRVVHAANSRWQSDVSQPLCLDWEDRFYNKELAAHNLLLPVAADTGRQIRGLYDQISGVLPVSGTDNVRGVVKFQMAWKLDNNRWSEFSEIRDLQAQSTCLSQQPLKDGETYYFVVRASDVMNNIKEDNVRVSIDYTGPEVRVQGLRSRWDTDDLHVHNSTDLSTLRLVLTAKDPHSGLSSISWTLATPLQSVIDQGLFSVQTLSSKQAGCSERDGNSCYCPAVGECEDSVYHLTFPTLSKVRCRNNDTFLLTLNVTNLAGVPTTLTLPFTVDETPPTKGVVWEGLDDDEQNETDLIRRPELLVQWRGFRDPESGVETYRVAAAERCLTAAELEASGNATVVNGTQTSLALQLPQQGLYFINVMAYNGVSQPSLVACSDGVLFEVADLMARRCNYSGRLYHEKQTWYDGCDWFCVCTDGTSSKYHCSERCPALLDLPPQCSRHQEDQCCFRADCSPGNHSNVTTITDGCVEGSYKEGSECKLCPLGSYQSIRGQSKCTECPVGTTTTAPGATGIQNCTALPGVTTNITLTLIYELTHICQRADDVTNVIEGQLMALSEGWGPLCADNRCSNVHVQWACQRYFRDKGARATVSLHHVPLLLRSSKGDLILTAVSVLHIWAHLNAHSHSLGPGATLLHSHIHKDIDCLPGFSLEDGACVYYGKDGNDDTPVTVLVGSLVSLVLVLILLFVLLVCRQRRKSPPWKQTTDTDMVSQNAQRWPCCLVGPILSRCPRLTGPQQSRSSSSGFNSDPYTDLVYKNTGKEPGNNVTTLEASVNSRKNNVAAIGKIQLSTEDSKGNIMTQAMPENAAGPDALPVSRPASTGSRSSAGRSQSQRDSGHGQPVKPMSVTDLGEKCSPRSETMTQYHEWKQQSHVPIPKVDYD